MIYLSLIAYYLLLISYITYKAKVLYTLLPSTT